MTMPAGMLILLGVIGKPKTIHHSPTPRTMVFELDEELAGRTITIRQTKNAFIRNPQYIAYSKVTLNDQGWLDMRDLGLGYQGGSQIYQVGVLVFERSSITITMSVHLDGWVKQVAMRPGERGAMWCGMDNGFLPPWTVREALEGGEGDVITVMDVLQDLGDACWCQAFAREHEDWRRRRKSCMDLAKKVLTRGKAWCRRAAPSSTGMYKRMMDSKELEGENEVEINDYCALLDASVGRRNARSGLAPRQKGGR